MSLHLRILLGFALLVSLAVYLFITGVLDELRPGVRQATEQTLVNTANLLAELAVGEMAAGQIEQGEFAAGIQAFRQRRFNAEIWSLTYAEPDLRVYVTDADGIVRFDSAGLDAGKDYSRWNDVYLTLKGEYGVRSSLADPANELSSVMHVAAPVRYKGETIGVLTVSRPNLSLQPFVDMAEAHVRLLGLGLLLMALLLGGLISYWLTRSIRRLTRYAEDVSAGRRVEPPELSEPELEKLSGAMGTMRRELEGKEYVENYIHTLTHELKSPLTAIGAAAEILADNPEPQTRQRFLANIESEIRRMRQLVDRLLSLAVVEKRTHLQDVEELRLADLAAEALRAREAVLRTRWLDIATRFDSTVSLRGERFLLLQAISNLLDNAIDFSPDGGTIRIIARLDKGDIEFCIEDEGPGIPDYALERVMERFYSLPRPGGQVKSSGLGLSFVGEVAKLHHGGFRLENTGHGARAILRLPAQE